MHTDAADPGPLAPAGSVLGRGARLGPAAALLDGVETCPWASRAREHPGDGRSAVGTLLAFSAERRAPGKGPGFLRLRAWAEQGAAWTGSAGAPACGGGVRAALQGRASSHPRALACPTRSSGPFVKTESRGCFKDSAGSSLQTAQGTGHSLSGSDERQPSPRRWAPTGAVLGAGEAGPLLPPSPHPRSSTS